MALTNCRECQAEISSEAKTCPHCGIQNPAPTTKHGPTWWGVVAGLIGVVVFFAISSTYVPPTGTPRPVGEDNGQHAKITGAASYHVSEERTITMTGAGCKTEKSLDQLEIAARKGAAELQTFMTAAAMANLECIPLYPGDHVFVITEDKVHYSTFRKPPNPNIYLTQWPRLGPALPGTR